MHLFGKPKPHDAGWEQVCHLEDALLGRSKGSTPPPPAQPPFRRVAVAIDGRGGSDAALQWAARLNKAGAGVWLVTVGAPAGPEQDRLTGELFLGQATDPEATLRQAQERMAALGGVAAPILLRGNPVLALGRFLLAQQADLAILGSPARGLLPSVGPVGVSQNLKAMGATSLLVARQPPGNAIWAATDGSRPARHAVGVAYAVARGLGLPLTLLHAREPSPGPEPTPGDPRPVPGASARLLAGRAPGVLLDALAYAPDALLVMGTRGRTGGALHTLGTVSDRVLATSPASVLVVPPEGTPGF